MLISILLSVILVCLLAASGFVSASETAYFSLSPEDLTLLEESDNPKDQLVLKLKASPDKLLSTILIANNIINISFVILSSNLLWRIFDFSQAPLLAFLIETVLITFILLLFGENLSKIYASSYPLRFARFSARILNTLRQLLTPFSWLLIAPTKKVAKLEKHNNALSINDLSQAYEITSDNIQEDKEILEGIIKFGNINVESAMTPRVDVVAVDINASFTEVMHIITSARYSRIPVFQDSLDKICGILYTKDIIAHINETDFNWKNLIRKANFVPLTKHINVLLEDFQESKKHIAIAVDEFGGTEGIITLEDVLEEIVGEISDEYDNDNDRLYARLGQNSFLFEAKILLNDFFKIEEIKEEDFDKLGEDVETLAGLILEIKGEIPTQDEEICYKNYTFTIISSNKRRIKSIKLNIKKEEITK